MNGKKLAQVNLMGGGWFNRELKIFVLFLGLISFPNLIFSNNTFALFTPTLSASVNQTNLQINGNQVINSTNKTTEIPFSFTVNTNNRTGYTATLSAETENTALTNTSSTTGVKINSISSAGLLGDFSNNTWGYKFGSSTNYAPIPVLSTPAQILQTAGKTNGNEWNQLGIGMKLADNLESGNYTNKLILSFVSNPYQMHAIMTEGPDFNKKLRFSRIGTSKAEHFKKSAVAPIASIDTVNIEDEESDYEIKLWFNPTDKTAYYYTEPEKVYLNADSSYMFGADSFHKSNILDLDLSNFDTSHVTNMRGMFNGMRNLTTLNLSNFDTSKVTDMQYMFGGVNNLTTLDLSNFDTSNVTNMEGMFYNMYNLTTLNLSSFNTSKVTRMAQMFAFMLDLTTLDLSNFDTSNVTNMEGMFYNMYNLTTLDLSNFNTSKVTDMNSIFRIQYHNDDNLLKDRYKDKLETIYVNNDFDTANLTGTYEMFANRGKLRGGNGSYSYYLSNADKTWLRVDDPAHGRPGYFTRKP